MLKFGAMGVVEGRGDPATRQLKLTGHRQAYHMDTQKIVDSLPHWPDDAGVKVCSSFVIIGIVKLCLNYI